jgi:hypothetical protein
MQMCLIGRSISLNNIWILGKGRGAGIWIFCLLFGGIYHYIVFDETNFNNIC